MGSAGIERKFNNGNLHSKEAVGATKSPHSKSTLDKNTTLLNNPLASFYGLFDVPVEYKIDKNRLKQRYYEISRNKNDEMVNKAYNLLRDDYKRAQLFLEHSKNAKPEATTSNDDPGVFLSPNFLEECLNMEQVISTCPVDKLQELSDNINAKVDKCRDNHMSMRSMNEWSYYRRLQKMIEERMPN